MNVKHWMSVGAVIVVAAAIGTWASSRTHESDWTATVVDADGNPIADARVTLIDPNASADTVDPNAPWTTTDAKGRFVLDAPSGGDMRVELLCEAPGYAHEKFHPPNKRPFEVTLEPATALAGRVLTEPGRVPVAGALVANVRYDGLESRYASTTDAEGRFRVEGIPANHPSDILVQAPGVVPMREEIPFGTERSYERDFLVPAEPVLRGRVIDLESQQPLADAEIVPVGTGSDGEYRAITRSDADGSFTITGEMDGWNGAWIEVKKSGYAGTRRELRNPRGWLDGTDVFTMGLVRECIVEGAVTDADGRAVTDAWVVIGQNSTPSGSLPIVVPEGLVLCGSYAKSTRTTSDGHYRIEAVMPWVRIDLILSSRRGVTQSAVPSAFGASGEMKRVDWVFPSQDTVIEGRITMNCKRAHARVSWRASKSDAGPSLLNPYELHKDGLFRFEGVPIGPVDVRIELGEGFEPRVEHVEVTRGAPTRGEFDLSVDLASIEGRVDVIGEDHPPGIADLGGIGVRATRDNDKSTVIARTEPDGSFRLALPNAEWEWWTIALVAANEAVTLGAKPDTTHVHAGAKSARLSVLRKTN